jgi:exopolyphosphatase/guanosine-5'-triphosphate,3'-diphosphate pyrophosphatase
LVTEIVPRWEFRSFGPSFPVSEERIAALGSSGETVDSDETYLLSDGPANVKIRDELIDVKVPVHVQDGLEQWTPMMKTGFPVSAADVVEMYRAWQRPEPTLAREAYSWESFLDEVVGVDPGIAVLDVHKRRARFTLGGCVGELTDLEVGERSTKTIAESEDAMQ